MRLFKISMATLTMFFVTSTAMAVEFSMIGDTTITITQGDAFQLNIALDNTSLTSNNGVVGFISGLAAPGASFVVTSGTSANTLHYASFCDTTQCFGGILNNDNAFFDSSDLSGGDYVQGGDTVKIVSSLAQVPGTADGAIDPGLDGVFGSHDVRDVQITMTAGSNAGQFDLTVGGTYSAGGNNTITNTATVTVNVPEPGALAASVASLGTVFALVGIRRRT